MKRKTERNLKSLIEPAKRKMNTNFKKCNHLKIVKYCDVNIASISNFIQNKKEKNREKN